MSEYPIQGDPTPFSDIYDSFFGKITDDEYLEWTKEDTKNDLGNMLVDSLSDFEFPRFPLYDFDAETEEYTDDDGEAQKRYTGIGQFNSHLTLEEINILAYCMVNTWLQRQITSIENTRQKYSGSDFKMTSQANHLAKLMELKKEAERQCFHKQRLYKRRKMIDNKGSIKSNWSTLMEESALDSD